MPTLRFNADLFRCINIAASTEETRYYLNGVLVEPHPDGVLLVATDGHRMLVALDVAGKADQSQIVKLTPDALKACKPARGEPRRDIVVTIGPDAAGHADSHGAAIIVTPDHDGVPGQQVGMSAGNCLVYGTFPDWRRAVPDFTKPSAANKGAPITPAPAAFNGDYLADFSRLGAELRRAFDPGTTPRPKDGIAMSIVTEPGGPALIHWAGMEYVFGVLMPMRMPIELAPPSFAARATSAAA